MPDKPGEPIPFQGRSGRGSQSALEAWLDDMRRTQKRRPEEPRSELNRATPAAPKAEDGEQRAP